MTRASYALHQTLLRAVKMILAAWERWLKEQDPTT